MSAIATPAQRLEERRPSRPVDAAVATTRASAVVREQGATARTPGCDGRALFDDGVRLEDAILGLWEDVVVEGRAGCPVCGGSMAAGSGHAACGECGAELS